MFWLQYYTQNIFNLISCTFSTIPVTRMVPFVNVGWFTIIGLFVNIRAICECGGILEICKYYVFTIFLCQQHFLLMILAYDS